MVAHIDDFKLMMMIIIIVATAIAAVAHAAPHRQGDVRPRLNVSSYIRGFHTQSRRPCAHHRAADRRSQRRASLG
jgi:hypothetical protein